MTIDDTLLPPTRAGAVAEQLRRLIQSGEIAPGSRLRQNEVAARFGVSTTPVREAFAELSRDGIVRLDAHRGATVFRPSLDELIEIYEIRGALEPLAAERAAARATAEELAELEAIYLKMKKTTDPARYVELNHVFHATIYDMAGKPRLAGIIEGLRKSALNYIFLTNPQPANKAFAAKVQEQHEEIIEALRARQGKRAARATKEHLQTTLTHITSLVSEEAGGRVESAASDRRSRRGGSGSN
jgi:DNA-binding GntR family transcriptional regulator